MFLPSFEIFLIYLNFLRYFLRYKISNPIFLVVNQTSTETFNCQNIMTMERKKKGKSIQKKPFINQFRNASNANFWLKPNMLNGTYRKPLSLKLCNFLAFYVFIKRLWKSSKLCEISRYWLFGRDWDKVQVKRFCRQRLTKYFTKSKKIT